MVPGLEMTVMMALQAGCSLNSDHPFFPQDVVASLTETPLPRLLVTTPVHLRALLGGGQASLPIGRIVSATAPLDVQLAKTAENTYGGVLEEIYGCTEAGSMATRRTSLESSWQLLDGMELHQNDLPVEFRCQARCH